VRYIDRHNVNAAIRYGIYRAVQSLLLRTKLTAREVRIVADGNYRFEYPALGMSRPMPRFDAYVKADQKYFPVSAASIVAKVRRDALIGRAAERFPGYGLERHAGYGTAAHRKAIAQLGDTVFHRKSFRGGAKSI
jgi:ribonuclease HII